MSFGGFVVSGVHKLNPSDPMYHVVLNAPAKRNDLSSVTIKASGDTSAIIVFDNQTSVRLNELKNDPGQLVRNIAMMIDKALQVVAKYATMGT